MSSNIKATPPEGITLEGQKMVLDAGILGKFFGSSQNAPTNIAGLIVVLLVLVCIASWQWPSEAIGSDKIWEKCIPLITLILGYLFGKRAH